MRYSRHITRGALWRQLRLLTLQRDGWQCVQCGAFGPRLEIDHIEPVRDAPERAHDPDNLQTLCTPCHTRKTGRENGALPPPKGSQEWRQLLRDMQRNPSSTGATDA